MLSSVFLVIVVLFTHQCVCHTYGPGSCPRVQPIPDFDMTKLLGRWYAIEKTNTKSSCVSYNFKEGSECGEYLLEQSSERYPTKFNVSYVFDYTGKIKADKNSPKMTIHFPLNIAGSASFDVVTTDYKTYAGIYTCQNLLFFKRQSATILSRTNTLHENILEKIKHTLDEHFEDLDLNSIRHDNCNEASSQILLSVKSNLASSINFSRTVPSHPGVTDLNKEIHRSIADVSYDVKSVEEAVETVEPVVNDIFDDLDIENFIEPRRLRYDPESVKFKNL